MNKKTSKPRAGERVLLCRLVRNLNMKKLNWYLRQCLPLTYRSLYREANGTYHFAVWKMWLGKVFLYEDYVIS